MLLTCFQIPLPVLFLKILSQEISFFFLLCPQIKYTYCKSPNYGLAHLIFILSYFKWQMDPVKELGFHVYLRKTAEEQQMTAKTTNTSLTGGACLHIGKTPCCLTPDSSLLHSSYQQHSAISQTCCTTMRHCPLAIRQLEDSTLCQRTFGKRKATGSQNHIKMMKATATGNAVTLLKEPC